MTETPAKRSIEFKRPDGSHGKKEVKNETVKKAPDFNNSKMAKVPADQFSQKNVSANATNIVSNTT